MLTSLLLYGLAIVAACWFYRPNRSYADFVVGQRSSGWFMTAFGTFTLIGGGELIVGSSLGYRYGWTGMSLYAGYAVGFVLLGWLSPRILAGADGNTLSYIDYATREHGSLVGHVVFVAQTTAFSALLVLQLAAGGSIVSQLAGVPYWWAVTFCATVIGAYLTVGGFRAVMLTDVIQGAVMLLLFVLVVHLASNSVSALPATFEPAGFDISWGALIGGAVASMASADVWQRLLGARTPAAVKAGFTTGGLLLATYGGAIVFLGIAGRQSGIVQSSDSAFLDTLRQALPPVVLYSAVFAAVAACLATADTEAFLVASLLERRALRRSMPGRSGHGEPPFRRRYVLGVLAAATTMAYWSTDLTLFLTLMFSTYMVFAPTIALSLFFQPGERGFLWSVSVTALVFVGLIALEQLTLEHTYVLVWPAAIVLPLLYAVRTGRSRGSWLSLGGMFSRLSNAPNDARPRSGASTGKT